MTLANIDETHKNAFIFFFASEVNHRKGLEGNSKIIRIDKFNLIEKRQDQFHPWPEMEG